MSDLAWRAEGIANAEAVGGVSLEPYRRPGFTGGIAIRRASEGGGGCGYEVDFEPYDDEDLDKARRSKRTR